MKHDTIDSYDYKYVITDPTAVHGARRSFRFPMRRATMMVMMVMMVMMMDSFILLLPPSLLKYNNQSGLLQDLSRYKTSTNVKMVGRYLVLCFLLSAPTSASGFFLSTPRTKTNPLLSDLEELIQNSSRDEDQIKSLMIDISASRKGDQRLSLPGQWELLFTTEKEVNFFKTSWPFAKVSSITQGIDPYKSCTVDNVISFKGGGEFAVIGTVGPAESDGEYDRVEFEFTSAVIRGWDRELVVPPVGAGWFDTMFCDDKYRLSRDNRGDWSVFRKL
jgi:hypothetical protein